LRLRTTRGRIDVPIARTLEHSLRDVNGDIEALQMHGQRPRATSLLTALMMLCAAGVGAPAVTALSTADAMAADNRVPKPRKRTRLRLQEGNTTFALKVFREISRDTTNNVMISPISLTLCLGMAYAGARGETASQMAQALRFLLPQRDLHRGLGWLSSELVGRGDSTSNASPKFKMANAIWVEKTMAIERPFVEDLTTNYGAGLHEQSFRGDPNGARKTINGWVERATEDRIKDLIPAGIINSQTRLVLTNAVYFLASWAQPFRERATTFDFFHPLSGKKRTSPLMQKTAKYNYMDGDGFAAVELDYAGGQLSMLAIVPDRGTYQEFATSLDTQVLSTILKRLTKKKLWLLIPRFTFESELDVGDSMRALGMKDAFSVQRADFSGMTGAPDLSVSAILQKTFVKVDERGTEAAAATVLAARGKSKRPPTPMLKIDRPFIFLIRDKPTGTVLFIGRMSEPTE
jgi:serpin B